MTVKFKADSSRWPTLSYRPLDLEREVRRFWKDHGILQKMDQDRLHNHKGVLGYVEGPPTLNGYPHVGHVRGRVIKDLRYRWKTMQGFYIPFWTGWDCQGLPVELEVERALKVKNKRDLLQRIGEERFVTECKQAIMKYYEAWHKADLQAGVFIDDSKAYWTYLDEYIEREWKILERSWQQDLLGEGYYVVAYCPHCQTSLSNAEVGMGYEDVEDPSLYFKLKRATSKDEYFLVWTTMPFTLVTDLMLAVHPDAEYVKARVGAEVWIVVQQRLEATMQELGIQDYTITETCLGRDLEGAKYEYPFQEIVSKQQELDEHPLVHTVVTEEFVDISTATGVVHLAPGNGEDDFNAAQKRGVPIFAPFDDEVTFTDEAGLFAGLFARDADKVVVDELKKRNLLVSVKQIRHEYPTCWRSHHKLVWFARREYFLWTNEINSKIIEAAEKVKYYYKPPKNRFLAFLGEAKPWCVSRERVWGTPLPVWKCLQCGEKTLVSSKKDLLEKAKDSPTGHFELHKPWIDRIVLTCRNCGDDMHREPFVLDTWHNSGAAPYARFTDAEFERYVPVDFLVEAIDQTRGWANTLLLEHVILTGKAEPPYKAFLFYGHVLDEKGRKMSKSLGNVIDANVVLDKASADLFRFYMLRKCSPIDAMNFDRAEMTKRPFQVLNTLHNLYRFFIQNAEYDRFDPCEHTMQWVRTQQTLKLPDKWILSKLQRTITIVNQKFESCEFNFALAELEEFVVNALSRQYVPMVRQELWSDNQQSLNRRFTVYAVLWQVLRTLNLLFNPITPFLSEAMYQQVHRSLDSRLSLSVNLDAWPTVDKRLVDLKLEENFEVFFTYLSLTYSARQTANLKRRWPLKNVIVAGPKTALDAIMKLEDLFLELSNVKTVEYTATLADLSSQASENRIVASENEFSVSIDTSRDSLLVGEGLMRDMARRIQALRKELGFSPMEILERVYIAELDQRSEALLKPHLESMTELVRTKQIEICKDRVEIDAEWHEYRIDKQNIYVAMPKTFLRSQAKK